MYLLSPLPSKDVMVHVLARVAWLTCPDLGAQLADPALSGGAAKYMTPRHDPECIRQLACSLPPFMTKIQQKTLAHVVRCDDERR